MHSEHFSFSDSPTIENDNEILIGKIQSRNKLNETDKEELLNQGYPVTPRTGTFSAGSIPPSNAQQETCLNGDAALL